jgi:hypothetical protein
MELSTERKKKFIIENSNILNRDIKLNILTIIMMNSDLHIKSSSETDQSIIMDTSNNSKKCVDINLDLLEKKDINVLNHIYNIIHKRLETLNKPIRDISINFSE